MMFREADLVQAPPVFGGRHPSCDLAQFPVQPEFPRREELLAQRGIEVSYETIRCWTIKFGPFDRAASETPAAGAVARRYLDEMVCSIGGRRMYLWRAVDDEGEVLDLVVQR